MRYKASPSVIAKEVEGDTFLFDRHDGRVYCLTGSGSSVWRTLQEGATIAEMQARLLEEFDTTAEVVDRDLRELLASLRSRRLVIDADE
jgi:hypothetical protein